jgi:hypothetical protein
MRNNRLFLLIISKANNYLVFSIRITIEFQLDREIDN